MAGGRFAGANGSVAVEYNRLHAGQSRSPVPMGPEVPVQRVTLRELSELVQRANISRNAETHVMQALLQRAAWLEDASAFENGESEEEVLLDPLRPYSTAEFAAAARHLEAQMRQLSLREPGQQQPQPQQQAATSRAARAEAGSGCGPGSRGHAGSGHAGTTTAGATFGQQEQYNYYETNAPMEAALEAGYSRDQARASLSYMRQTARIALERHYGQQPQEGSAEQGGPRAPFTARQLLAAARELRVEAVAERRRQHLLHGIWGMSDDVMAEAAEAASQQHVRVIPLVPQPLGPAFELSWAWEVSVARVRICMSGC